MIRDSRCAALVVAFGFAVATSFPAQAAKAPDKNPRVAAIISLPSTNPSNWDIDDSEGYVSDGGNDAFDDYGYLTIEVKDAANTTTLQASSTVTSLGLVTSGSNRLVTTTPYAAGGVSVSRAIYAIPGTNLLRYVDTLSNTSGALRNVRIAFGGDLGSDSRTTVQGTSSGDLFITATDNWMVSTDQALATNAVDDPPVGVAWSNRSAAAFIGTSNGGDVLTDAFTGNGDDGFSAVYAFALNAGETKVLGHFVYRGLSEGGGEGGGEGRTGVLAAGDERALAITTMAGVVSAPPFSDLTTQEKANLYNWALAAAPTNEPAVAVPTTGWEALTGLAALIALGGALTARRRKQAVLRTH